jgi:hypothetical protein
MHALRLFIHNHDIVCQINIPHHYRHVIALQTVISQCYLPVVELSG